MMPNEERKRFIDDICKTEPEIAAELQDLMDSLEDSEGFLESPIQESSTALFKKLNEDLKNPDEDGSRLINRHLGAYRITDKIADGGMSSVYLAERADGYFDQSVAIKIMRLGLETRESEQQFAKERQILASLNHPNIANILDGGVYEDGTPYLVMEYIEGLPLDEYCKNHNLSLEERINIFLTVCDAVKYAHRNLVIHRDLKPNNIFVTNDGHVKLLDFGIARLIEDHNSPDSSRTQTAQQFLSLDFSAPELLTNDKITTSTDIYSLGIILHLLLTDSKPYQLKGSSLSDIERVITSDPVTKPSKKLHNDINADSANSTAPVSPKKLKGDLDNIILKALYKEPGYRYQSVDELIDDLYNYLENRPVSARSATITYQMRKFFERNKILVSSTVLVLIFLTSATLFSIHQANIADENARIAQEERDRAQSEATKSEEVAGFLQDLFEAGDPFAEGEDMTIADVLGRGAEKVETDLEDQPEVRAELMRVIGNVYHSLGNFDQARSLLEQSVQVREDHYGLDHLELARGLNELGSLLRDKGDLAEAEALHRRALAIRRSQLDEMSIPVAESLNNLAAVLYDADRYRESLPYYEEALEIFRYNYDDNHPHLAAITNNLANVYYEFNDYDRARQLYTETLQMDRDIYGEDHPHVATSLNNLGRALADIGLNDEADSMLVTSLQMRKQHLGEMHPFVAQSLYNIAILRSNQGDYDAADSLYNQALNIRRQELGEDHPRVATALNGLALMHQRRGDLNEAKTYFEEAQSIIGLSSHSVTRANLTVNYANLLRRMGDYTSSETYLRQALDTLKSEFDTDHADIADTYSALGQTRHAMGYSEEALEYYREAESIYETVFGEHVNSKIADNKRVMGESLLTLNRLDESDSLLQESIRIKEQISSDQHPAISQSLRLLVNLEIERGNYSKAESYAHQSLNILRGHYQDEHWRIAQAQGLLGEVYLQQGELQAASTLLEESYSKLREIRGEDDEITVTARDRLASLQQSLNDSEVGEVLHSEADHQ